MAIAFHICIIFVIRIWLEEETEEGIEPKEKVSLIKIKEWGRTGNGEEYCKIQRKEGARGMGQLSTGHSCL